MRSLSIGHLRYSAPSSGRGNMLGATCADNGAPPPLQWATLKHLAAWGNSWTLGPLCGEDGAWPLDRSILVPRRRITAGASVRGPVLRRQLEAVEGECRRHGAACQRPRTLRARRLPAEARHDHLRALALGQIGAEMVEVDM